MTTTTLILVLYICVLVYIFISTQVILYKIWKLQNQLKAQEPIDTITYPDPEQEARIQKTAQLSKARKAKKAS